MNTRQPDFRFRSMIIVIAACLLAACGPTQTTASPTPHRRRRQQAVAPASPRRWRRPADGPRWQRRESRRWRNLPGFPHRDWPAAKSSPGRSAPIRAPRWRACRHPAPRSTNQWRTIPVCERVNAVYTPRAYNGISASTWPPKMMTSTIETTASTMTPESNARRSPRKANCRGK